jgi:hypothetical protein
VKKLELVHTDNYMLLVSDEEIKEGDWVYNRGIETFLQVKNIWIDKIDFLNSNLETFKVVAYQPKGNVPELDLPLLPETVVKDDVENLAEKYFPDYPDGIVTNEIKVLREGFIKGYKAATKKYSEEDLINLVAYIANFEDETDGNIASSGRMPSEIVNSFIQTLNQPKYFIGELGKITGCKDPMVCLRVCVIGTDSCKQPILDYTKLKTNIVDGKTYLVGKYSND